jgi:hypothetical protein
LDWGPIDIGPAGHWSSLAYDRGRLFVTDSSGALLAVDPTTGNILWDDANPSTGGTDSPTAVGGVIYTGPGLQAYSEKTGRLLWWDTTTRPTGLPAVAGGRVYTAGVDDNLAAFTTAGQPLWSYAGPDWGITAVMPVVSRGQVFVRSPTVGYQSAGPGWIHRVSNGTQLGTFSSFALPAVSASSLYTTVSIEATTGVYDTYGLQALNRSDNSVAWSFDGDNQLSSSPLLANGVVYEGSWGEHLYALDASTGSLLWSSSLGAAVPPSNETQLTGPLSGLSIGGGYLVVPSVRNGQRTGPTLSAFSPSGPAGTLSGDSVSFGRQAVATTSQTATLSLTNTGGKTLSVGTARVTGADPADFALTSDHCSGADLAPDGACTFAVNFTPSAAGRRTASVILPANDGQSHAVAVAGRGAERPASG